MRDPNNRLEKKPLLDHSKEPSRCLIWTRRGVETTLGLAGLGVILFYLGPSKECAQSVYCGQWFSDLVSEKVAVPVFLGGGAGYAAATYVLSTKVFSAFEKALEGLTPIKKILKGSAIVLFATSQTLPLFLNALITAPSPMIIGISVAASIPSAFYGAGEFIDNRFLKLWKYIQSLYDHTHQDVITRAERKFYLDELKKFKKQVEQNYWHRVLTHGSKPQVIPGLTLEDDSVDAILSARGNDSQNAMGYSSYRQNYLTILISLILTVILAIPFWMPMVNMLVDYGVPYWLSQGLTFFFNISMIESNFFVSQAACNALVHLMSCLFTKQPIHSWDYALHPKKTITALSVVFLLSIMSYCFANISFLKTVPIEDEILKWVMVGLVVMAIDVYHFSAHYQVYGILLRQIIEFFNNENDKHFVALEKRKIELCNLSLDQWMDLIKNNDPLVKHITRFSSFKKSLPDALPPLLDKSPERSFFSSVGTFFKQTFQSSKNPLDVDVEKRGVCCFPQS